MIAGIRRTISGGALKSPQFRLLLGAGMAMQLGQWIQRVALLWTVYDLTGSAVQLAGLGFLSNIFVLVLSPFVGPLADKYGARRVLLGAALGQAIGAMILTGAVFGGFVSIPLLYVIGMGFGIGQSLNGPTRNLLVYDTVGRDLLRNGIALNSLTGSTMRVIGPSFGGIILGLRGADLAFGLQAVLLIIAVWLVWALNVDSRRAGATEASMWRALAGGIEHLRENAPVRVNVLTAFIASTLVYPYVQFMPVFVRENMGGAEAQLGLLFSGVGIGSLVGLWYVAAGRGNMAAMLWAGAIYMGLIGAFAMATNFWVGFGLLIVAGVVHSIFSGLNQALVQLNSAEEYRARMLGIYSMSGGLEPFSFLALGVLMEHIGAGPAMAGACGVATVVVVVLAIRATMGAFQARPAPPPPAT
jgi:hypothetical protein